MAVSSIEPRKASLGKTISDTLSKVHRYDTNPEKTRDGELVTAYMCDPLTADKEFMASKHLYLAITGRKRAKDDDVISYRVFQSFKPGEIDPETANKIGYELVMEFTGGKHQFVVSTHEDKSHIHNHIEFNSTTLDCTHKFDNPYYSYKSLRAINDRLCRERGLSVIEEPEGKKKQYAEWDAERKGKSFKAQTRAAIDALLPDCASLDDLLDKLRAQGYQIKRGNQLSYCAPGQTRFTRGDTLGPDYSDQALRERVGTTRPAAQQRKSARRNDKGVNLIIDLQNNLKCVNSKGYAQWAKIHNLQEMAKTLNFITDHGITEYDQLAEIAGRASADFADVSTRIKQLEGRMAEIAALKTHIYNYSKTRDIYKRYQKSRFKQQFYADHEPEILLHMAAKNAFDSLKVKKIPAIADLQAEYASLLDEKKSRLSDYSRLKKGNREWQKVKRNVDSLLEIKNAEVSTNERYMI